MSKTIIIYLLKSSFVKKDIDLLRNKYDVIESSFHPKHKIHTPYYFFLQFFWLSRNIFNSKIIISHFAGYHSFLPGIFSKIFNIPFLIIVGGTECVSFPSIGYGNFNKKILSLFTKISFRLASHIAPKHESLMLYNYQYQDKDYPYQGILFFCPGLSVPYTVINNGYDEGQWKPSGPKKKRTFLTVAAGFELPFTVQLKGIDLILQIAPRFPDCTFTIIGAPVDFFDNKPDNVICIPEVPNEELIKYYSESEFYLQLSMSEGFPNAICEAMLCECIPIGSDVNAIPEIIGDTGYILKKKDPVLLKKLIISALNNDTETRGINARNRILEHFPASRRREALLKLVESMIRQRQTI